MRRFSFFRALHAIMPLVIYYVVSYCVIFAFIHYGNEVGYKAIDVEHIVIPTWILIISNSAVAVILFVSSYKKDYLPLKLSKKLPLTFFAGAFAAVAFNLLIAYICIILKADELLRPSAYTRNASFGLGLVLFGITSPVMEEIIFRWLMYGRIKIMIGRILAPILTSLFFGFYHGNLLQGIYAFIMGMIMIVLYESCQSLLASILFHMGANVAMYTLSFLTGKLMDVAESPVVCFLTFVLGTIIIMYIYNHKEAGNV